VGALGDVLLTRRLTYSLALRGFRSTLFAPARHAALLSRDSWVSAVLDSESPGAASAFEGDWPEPGRRFDLAIAISGSAGLLRAAASTAVLSAAVSPEPLRDDTPLSRQWAEAAGTAFTGTLPRLSAGSESPAAFAGATFIHPGSGSPRKNWPMGNFLALSADLKARGHRVFWIRGPAEAGSGESFTWPQVLDLPALGELARALSGARLFVGNDSGVSHLAAAVGTPTAALFGPTNPLVWRPDGGPVAVVRSPSGRMEDLAPEAVLAGIEDLARLAEAEGR